MIKISRVLGVVVSLSILIGGLPAAAQDVGALLSPGPLSKVHAKLEGLKTCDSCHEPGKGVSAAKCLECHKPVAERMDARRGVHREVTRSDDCSMCHTEHAGRDADIRPIDTSDFDHRDATGFPLDGRHAKVGADCAKCHKTRSFLTLTPECSSCHKDTHRGALGVSCVGCHSTAAAFKETGLAFDHTQAAYQLDGAHTEVECAKCHTEGAYRGLSFNECSDCHKDPHGGSLGASCVGCHISTAAFATTTVDHGRTDFPLEGAHKTVRCEQCHSGGSNRVDKPAHARCADCHKDPHVGAFKEDCAACHTVSGFAGSTFDHAARTDFVLLDRHAEILCAACHKIPTDRPGVSERTLDFRGLSTDCATCHKDPHSGDLGTACASCHGAASFGISAFDHQSSPEFFRGKHATAECSKCHTAVLDPDRIDSMVSSRTYRGLPTTCATCHTDSHLGQLGADCASCHAVDEPEFSAALFDHQKADFTLTGQHAEIKCETCHQKKTGAFPSGDGTAVRFTGMSDACVACHDDPHLGEVGTTCQTCHTTVGFSVSKYTHRGDTDFHLGEHAGIACEKCHSTLAMEPSVDNDRNLVFSDVANDNCATCHDDVHKGTLGADCAVCHTNFAPFKSASRAFHKDALMPLEGRHLAVPCAECHLNGQIEATPTTCYDCHWIRRQDDRYRTALGVDCENCHRPTSWTAVNWDHASATGVPLTGAHATLDCDSCHTTGHFNGGTPSDCVSCHLGDYQKTDDPNHMEAGFPTDCQLCHNPSDGDWDRVGFNHATFPLVGTHVTLDCAECHSSGVYQGLPAECVDCHLTDYQKTDDPNHIAAGFPTDCELCHAPSSPSWDGVSFNHTGFQLVGTHATLDCAECHSSGVYQGLPAECVDCHGDDFQQSVNPNHLAAGFDTECETCHRASDPAWQGGQYPHSIFPLVATHETQPCNACHSANVFQGLPAECVDCHITDYQQTTDPAHAAAGFPTDCLLCHSSTSPTWEGVTFDHTTFQLAGAHTTLDCAECHSSGVYQGLPSDCVDCHITDYQETEDPNHAVAGFPTDCLLCHSSTSPTWDGAAFDHTTFQLAGAHTALDCAECHSSGVYQGLPSNCVDCHITDYQETDDPDHAVAGFPTDCVLCHSSTSPTWEGATFNHSSFQLVGSHVTLDCAECHSSGVYQGLPAECVDCHGDDHQQATNPNHLAAGFDTDCETCHQGSAPSWQDGQYPHSIYPLVATHEAQPCNACHSSNVFQGLPSDCVDCHIADYQQTTDPAHAAAGFPTDCVLCHAVTSPTWQGATFDHSNFQLVGTHATLDCADCHSSGVYQGLPSDCVDCHIADYQQATNPNHPAAGFNTDCETCHGGSDASWNDGQFPHSIYPLMAAHQAQPCNACHSSNVFQGLPSDCVDCHLSDYQQTDDPDHVAAGFPTDCELCHSNTSPTWTGASFDHSIFQLLGTHATLECADCHSSGVYQGLPSDCVDCHLNDYQQTTDPDHIAAGFPTDCEICHRGSDLSWDQGNFNHVWFPINSGAHRNRDCSECHPSSGNFAVFTCTTSCHPRSDTDPDHDEVPGYVYNSAACYSCHPNGESEFGRSRSMVRSHGQR